MRENGWLEVLILVSFVLFTAYGTYQVWFELPRTYRKAKRASEKLPKWYPFAQYIQRRFKRPFWIWRVRIINTLIVILSFAALVIVLGQVLFGIWK